MRYDPRAAHEKFRDRDVGLSCVIVGDIYWNPLPQVLSGLEHRQSRNSALPSRDFFETLLYSYQNS
jgi:hypothetical protein